MILENFPFVSNNISSYIFGIMTKPGDWSPGFVGALGLFDSKQKTIESIKQWSLFLDRLLDGL